MNKTKIFFLFALSAMLFACGDQDYPSDEKGSPPKLKKSSIVISPFDTIKAEFDSEIANINEIKISTANADKVSPPRPSKKTLHFIGTYGTTPGGLPYLRPGSLDSIVFGNIKNENGDTKKTETLTFYTHPIFDGPQNNTIDGADDIDSFAESLRNGVIFAGVLDHIPSQLDLEDNFKLNLSAEDTIEITVGNFRSPLSVQFIDPSSTLMNVKKGNSNTLKTVISTAHLKQGYPIDTMMVSYIKVRAEEPFSRPNPYTLSVSVKRRR